VLEEVLVAVPETDDMVSVAEADVLAVAVPLTV
jgi:hypothetical protein